MRRLKPFSIYSALLRAIRLTRAGSQRSLSSPLFLLPTQIGKRDTAYLFGTQSRYLSSTVETLLEYERDEPLDDGKVVEKESILNLALSQLAGDFDRESNLTLNRFFCTRHTSVISTGSLKLDLALGIGGLPRGRIVEIFGKEASGKTTLALHIVKEAQKIGVPIWMKWLHSLMSLSNSGLLGSMLIFLFNAWACSAVRRTAQEVVNGPKTIYREAWYNGQ